MNKKTLLALTLSIAAAPIFAMEQNLFPKHSVIKKESKQREIVRQRAALTALGSMAIAATLIYSAQVTQPIVPAAPVEPTFCQTWLSSVINCEALEQEEPIKPVYDRTYKHIWREWLGID